MTLHNHINIVEYNFEFGAVITMHFKGVIIYLRSHNLLINNVSFSDYLLGNFNIMKFSYWISNYFNDISDEIIV